ncbi:MAG: NAD(P)-binding domain-containing protein [Lapillicoccus sp.]
MTTISIIGSGTMATAIGTRAVKHGHAIELMSRDAAKAQALADRIGAGATVGTFGARPAGDIVIVAVLHSGAVDVVRHYGEALSGKTLVDITNPFNADATAVVTTEGGSVSQQMAAAAPEGASVVKAFNTIFSGVIAADRPMDVLFAGGDAEGKDRFAAFLRSLDMRPVDTGGLDMTYVLEWAGILLMGVARNGAGFEVALGADVL